MFKRIYLVVEGTEHTTNDHSELMGHLKPFGEQGVNFNIEERFNFPEPNDFLINYFKTSRPVKFAGVLKSARPVTNWFDDYLLALDIPTDSVVQLETVKKETRTQDILEMHFHEFLRKYNETEYYLVDTVPPYLRSDVPVPCSLQCEDLLSRGFDNSIMWFSSGNTKSVIHTDSYENIICVFRGSKTLIMAEPKRDRSKVALNKNGFSEIDVDSVDLLKYPDVANIMFYNVSLKAGDCLYIPFKWIHQVRSVDSNIAVNFWVSHYFTKNLLANDEAVCQTPCDPYFTLDKVEISPKREADNVLVSPETFRDWCEDMITDQPLTIEEFVEFLIESAEMDSLHAQVKDIFFGIASKLDSNHDGLFSIDDMPMIDMEVWTNLHQQGVDTVTHVSMDEYNQRKEYAEYLAAERREEL